MPETVAIPEARRSDLVAFKLLADGVEVPPEVELLSAEVVFAVNRVPHARFVFRDGDVATGTFALSESDALAPGVEIEFQLGYHEELNPVFKGRVTRHGISLRNGRPSQLVIECRHPAFQMTLTRRCRQFNDQTDSDIASSLLGEYGLAGEVASATVTHSQMVQYAATDWDFLLRRARANGWVVVPGIETVSVREPDYDADPSLGLGPGGVIELFEGGIEARDQPGSVVAAAWDPAAQERIESTAESAVEPEAGQPDGARLAGGIGFEAQHVWHGGALASDELEQWAARSLFRHRLAKLRARARCQGTAAIRPGGMVRLEGLGARFNGATYVAAVRHEITTGTWRTDCQLGLDPSWFPWAEEGAQPAAGLLPSPHGLQVGRVIALEGDPASGERIQVGLPVTHPEGLWARLATLEAGADRGHVFRPEIGDEVVVGFLEGDPRHPVVLGALHSAANAAPIPASDDNHEKGYTSRSGMKVHFNDDTKVLTLSTEAGNRVVLSEAEQGITLEDQNGNRIVLSPDGIVIESQNAIEIKATADGRFEAVNLNLNAQAQAKVEGGAQTELSSSGTTTVRGSLVQIN
ncbi:MAG: type VI secretion system tip protein VgrG [Verrucomicrobiales bacterium]|nr:type VI secretion system tip protein VgrG [Verrucomicrobiales bacterium]